MSGELDRKHTYDSSDLFCDKTVTVGLATNMYENLHVFYVAFGGNVETDYGTPFETMKAALNALQSDRVRITKTSRIFQTPAFPAGSGPDYANGVVVVRSELTASALLEHLHAVEAEFGRLRKTRWGARTLDLDLLAMEDNVLPDNDIWQSWHDLPLEKQVQSAPDQLILPHPRIQDRAFVLVPFCDVAPDWVHPVLGKSVQEMSDALPNDLKNEVKPL